MRELTYYVAVSIDGYIASPDGAFDAFPVEGDHMAALMDDYADTIPAHIASALGIVSDHSRFDTVLMGWNTYAVGLEQGVDSPYPHLRQVVVSSERTVGVDGIETTNDPVGTVRKLKGEPGTGIWLCGGGALAGALATEIDRLVLKVNPVLLGAGIPLFGGHYEPQPFRRITTRAFQSGVVLNEYTRVAQPATGAPS